MNEDSGHEVLEFKGGKYTSLVPFLIFVAGLLGCAIAGHADMEAFWLVACLCIAIRMCLSKDIDKYFAAIIEGAASPLYITPIFCWIFAGMFAAVLKVSGLGNGLVWLGLKLNLGTGLFCGITFVLSAIYSTSTGSGSAAIVTVGALLYPAGIVIGCNPLVLVGAVVGGGAFGDNLAPISDSTIVAAATMGVDIPGVVRTRLPYTLTAGAISFTITTILGYALPSAGTVSAAEYQVIMAQATPKGLIMLIPAVLVIILAFRGMNLIMSMSIGMLTSVIIGIPTKLLTFHDLVCVNEDGSMGGAFINGAGGFIGLIVFVILSAAVISPMITSGAIGSVLEKLKKFIKSPSQAEVVNWCTIAISAFGLCNNVTSQIVAGPIMKGIAEEYHISKYRAANFSDSVQAMFGYTMPWGGQSILMCATCTAAAATYSWCPAITNPLAMIPYTVHAFVIAFVFLISAITGIGRKFDEKIEEEENELIEAQS